MRERGYLGPLFGIGLLGFVGVFAAGDPLYSALWKDTLPRGSVPLSLAALSALALFFARKEAPRIGTKGLTKSGILGAVALLSLLMGNRLAVIEIRHEIADGSPDHVLEDVFTIQAARQYVFDRSVQGAVKTGFEWVSETTGFLEDYVQTPPDVLRERRAMSQYVPGIYQIFGWLMTIVVALIVITPMTMLRGLGFSFYPLTRKIG